jgi:hypothetical protein
MTSAPARCWEVWVLMSYSISKIFKMAIRYSCLQMKQQICILESRLWSTCRFCLKCNFCS